MVDEGYAGIILNFRLGRKTQHNNQCLIKVLNASGEEVNSLVGGKVFWPEEDTKIRGTIIKTHGSKGVLIARFRKGLPGQAINSHVKIKR